MKPIYGIARAHRRAARRVRVGLWRVHRRRLRRGRVVLLALAALALLALAAPARAECVRSGDQVTCAASDLDAVRDELGDLHLRLAQTIRAEATAHAAELDARAEAARVTAHAAADARLAAARLEAAQRRIAALEAAPDSHWRWFAAGAGAGAAAVLVLVVVTR